MYKLLSIVLLLLFIFVWGCDKPGETEDSDRPDDEHSTRNIDKDKKDNDGDKKTGFKDIDDFVDNVKQFQKDMEKGEEIEPADFRDLKALLPDEIGDLKRVNATGQKTNAFGVFASETEGIYKYVIETDSPPDPELKDGKITIKITDLGNMKGWGSFAAFAWTFAEVDKETDSGYEKTIVYKGHKGFEEYNFSNQSGRKEVLVDKRFMVSVDGFKVPMDLIDEGLDEIDMDIFEELKHKGLKSIDTE